MKLEFEHVNTCTINLYFVKSKDIYIPFGIIITGNRYCLVSMRQSNHINFIRQDFMCFVSLFRDFFQDC